MYRQKVLLVAITAKNSLGNLNSLLDKGWMIRDQNVITSSGDILFILDRDDTPKRDRDAKSGPH